MIDWAIRPTLPSVARLTFPLQRAGLLPRAPPQQQLRPEGATTRSFSSATAWRLLSRRPALANFPLAAESPAARQACRRARQGASNPTVRSPRFVRAPPAPASGLLPQRGASLPLSQHVPPWPFDAPPPPVARPPPARAGAPLRRRDAFFLLLAALGLGPSLLFLRSARSLDDSLPSAFLFHLFRRRPDQRDDIRNQPMKRRRFLRPIPIREVGALQAPKTNRRRDMIDLHGNEHASLLCLISFVQNPVGLNGGLGPKHEDAASALQFFPDRAAPCAARPYRPIPKHRPAISLQSPRENLAPVPDLDSRS